MKTTEWTTLYRPPYLADLHSVWFLPLDFPGYGPVVTLGIPECELIRTDVVDGLPYSVVNRTKVNRRIKYWVRLACELARDTGSVASFICDTAEQAAHAARMAAKLLPNYERVALERMHNPETRLPRRGLV